MIYFITFDISSSLLFFSIYWSVSPLIFSFRSWYFLHLNRFLGVFLHFTCFTLKVSVFDFEVGFYIYHFCYYHEYCSCFFKMNFFYVRLVVIIHYFCFFPSFYFFFNFQIIYFLNFVRLQKRRAWLQLNYKKIYTMC